MGLLQDMIAEDSNVRVEWQSRKNFALRQVMGQTGLQLRTSQGTDSSLNKVKIILGVIINLKNVNIHVNIFLCAHDTQEYDAH